jgi:cation:H+ antiporter
VQPGIFALSALVSLAASAVLVLRLERVGERLGLSEAMLGLLAALAADGPNITASVAAIAGGHTTVGIGVALGSNVFILAALLGLSALIVDRIGFHRRTVLLEGGIGLWIALLALAVVTGLAAPALGLFLVLVVFVPYVAYSAEHPAVRARCICPDAGRIGW